MSVERSVQAAGVHHWARARGERVALAGFADVLEGAIGATTPSPAGILPVSRASAAQRRMANAHDDLEARYGARGMPASCPFSDVEASTRPCSDLPLRRCRVE